MGGLCWASARSWPTITTYRTVCFYGFTEAPLSYTKRHIFHVHSLVTLDMCVQHDTTPTIKVTSVSLTAKGPSCPSACVCGKNI